ncbi:MAG: rhodanese-like domain-containing protein [Desulfobacterales bacterium]|jgi:rhodanese-related sulfurtransferase|nr:rhodanese-like domain-containing protein [Desulfobacterales bacterium]
MVKGVIILFSAAVVTALTVNHFSPWGIALIGNWNTEKGVISAKPKNDVVAHEREIGDIHIVKEIYDRGGALFVDARPVEVFNEGHIAGAVPFPAGEMEERIEAFINTHAPETRIITYCSGRECEDSHILAEYLTDFGFKTVQVFVDGFPAWEKEGYPVE